jgi:hypothetical protein
VASAAGTNIPSYYDLESYSQELEETLSLSELARLCGALRVSSRWLISGTDWGSDVPLDAHVLTEVVRQHLERTGEDREAYGDRVGWEGSRLLESPDSLMGWSVEGLRHMCGPLGPDYLIFLPS